MLRQRIVLTLMVAALAVAGCGGGDAKRDPDEPQGGGGTTTTTEPEPTADPQVALDARKAELQGEIKALKGIGRRGQIVFYKLDGLALDVGSAQLKADSRRLTRLTNESDGPDGGFRKDFDRFLQRIEKQQAAATAASWKTGLRKLDRLKLKAGPIADSTRAYQAFEWRRAYKLTKEFLRLLRTEKNPGMTFSDYYQKRVLSQSTRFPVVIGAAARAQGGLIRGLKKDVKKLGALSELGPGAPSVGDAYRRAIKRLYVSPYKKVSDTKREQIVAREQWLLWRIRELEETPMAAYENAYLSIMLQSRSDLRNPYASLLDATAVIRDHYVSNDGDLRELRRKREWALGILGRPTPPLLVPTRNRLVKLLSELDLSAPPADDTFAIFRIGRELEKSTDKPLVRALRRGAKAADSTRKDKAAFVAAVEATKQSGEPVAVED